MIVNPEQYINTFADLGADILTVHFEACTHLHRTVQAIKAAGMKAGVALNPHTPIARPRIRSHGPKKRILPLTGTKR